MKMYPPPSWKPPGAKSSKKTGGHSAVMATTRAATFSAKIRTLSDFHTRIVNQQQPPSNAEIVTTLRYFQQTLVGFLKEIPSERSGLFERYNTENATIRSTLYPNLNYSGLFYGIVNLLDAFPLLTSAQAAIAEAILDTLKALYFFLDRDCIDQMPMLLASQLGSFPAEIDRRLVHLLCDCILPYSFGEGANGRVSVTAVLLLILHHPSDPSLHTMAIESLASRLPDLFTDLLSVVASGTSESRIAAANLLFHYWPLMNPAILHRKTIQYRVHGWSSPPCQNVHCIEKGPSVRYTYEPILCGNLGDSAPPIFFCRNCAESAQPELPMPFLCQPLPSIISATCQNKGCSSTSRIAVGTCFDESCIRSHGHIPLRLCQECFTALHQPETPASEHIRHCGHGIVWGDPLERVMVEAIVKLLRETSARLIELSSEGEAAKRPKWLRQLEAGREIGREVDPLSDERRMLSRFGIWLMAAHCPPNAGATPASVGYLLSALFQWFATTALLPNDAMGQTLEQLKSDFSCEWLNQALANHYEVFVSELLPQQLEPITAGDEAIWDVRAVRREQMRDGLGKLLALAPYDVVSLDTWSRVMPHWLHALNTDLMDEEELLDLKVPLSKLFEPDLCPLPFEAHRLFEFLATRLQAESYDEVLKALDWLHLLTRIDIRISLELLLDMFSTSLKHLPIPVSTTATENQKIPGENMQPKKEPEIEPTGDAGEVDELIGSPGQEQAQKQPDSQSQQIPIGPLAAQLIMTDILAQQIKLAGGAPALNSLLERLFSVITSLLQYQPEAEFVQQGWAHSCKDPEGDQFADCLRCQQALFLYQVLLQIIEQFCPKEESRLDAFVVGEDAAKEFADWLSEASSSVHHQASNYSPRPSPSPRALSTSSPAGPAFFASPGTQRRQPQQKTSTPLIKARQEVSTPGVELVAALPSEEVETAQAQAAMSIAEQSPMGLACISATVVGVVQPNGAGIMPPGTTESTAEKKLSRTQHQEQQRIFWETSVGRFRFSLDQMPAQLRLTYILLSNIDREPDPDVQFFLLSLLKYLLLHKECLVNARREQEHRGFLVWIQENLLIPKLWTLLRSDFSHVGQMAVPLILHAITLPLGDDVFWDNVNREFTSDEWERRLKAADRVLVLAHFVPPAAVRNNRTLMTSLSCAFSHLIVSAHDPNPAVAQKALLSLEALPHNSLVLICQCLESQFDSCILDRPLIIARIHLLTMLLPDESLLSWDFFIQRFESLALEAQLKAQQNAGADTSAHFVQDLLHTDPMSELYQRKITRARQSLNEADSVRSIVRSLRESSLRHQLNPGTKGDQQRRDQAQQLLRVRHRRGAVVGAEHGGGRREMARLRLRKVLVVVRVVSAWRDLAGRLLLPTSRRSSRLSQRSALSATLAAELEEQQQQSELAEHPEEMGLLMETRRSLQSTPPLLLLSQQHLPIGSSRGGSACSLALDPSHPSIHATLSNASLSPMTLTGDARYGRMREFTDEESNLCLLLNRVVDMQNPERHTVFLVVSLFVHFLASKKCGPADNAKKQSVLLRHFNTLLGYSNSDKCFTIPPARLRRAAVCNAFLHGLPEVLDSNLLIGNQLLAIVLQLLLYLPSPQKFASDAPSADYSLRLLSAQQRHNWLHAVIILLYKYRCDVPPTSESIKKLMLIVVQTLEQQCHRCPSAQSEQIQQQGGPIPPEKKERRSAVGLLDAPQGWSSTDSEGSGDDEPKERLPTMEEVEEDKERKKSGPALQRPESLRILSVKEAAGRERKESTKSMAKGTDFVECGESTRPPAIALHPPAMGSGRFRHRSSGFQQGGSHQNQPQTHPLAAPHRSTNLGHKSMKQPSEHCKLSCGSCGSRLERFDEETLSLCCVALCTFLHRATSLAAPLLPRTLRCVAHFIDTPHFPWHESNIFVPGNARSAAKQLIRIILHQLSSSGIALQLFNLPIQADELHPFWSRIGQALADFTELNPISFFQNLLEDMSEGWPMRVTRILHNLAIYIQYVPMEAISNWTAVIAQLDGLYRRLHSQLAAEPPSQPTIQSQMHQAQQQKQFRSELTSSVLVMSRVFRVQSFATIKGAVQLIEAFAKWLVEILHKCPVDLWDLLTVCTACNRGMIRERDKQILTRAVVSELVAALKFKCELAEPNYLTIVRLVLQDFGEPLGDDWAASTSGLAAFEGGGEDNESSRRAEMANIGNGRAGAQFESQQSFGGVGDQFNTGAAEAIRPHVPELLEFIADMHVLAKLKKQSASNSDRVGGDLKAGLAEIIALEMSRPSVRDSRTVMRFIPWLYSPPSLAQALPGQFAESVANVRVLSWILLGALHARGGSGLCPLVSGNLQQQQAANSPSNACLPVPIACSGQMADYIHFVLAGFADQSKQSVVHMSALFHAFHLCQLWTIYCEQTAAASRSEETLSRTMQQILDFWARVTPAILQLLSHSKVLADMVNLHFVNTLQALQQVNSAVLCQLYPMWEPVLTAHHAHVPRQLRLKLDAVEAQPPMENPQMRPWLSKVRYKISQIELQTSAASPFYNV